VVSGGGGRGAISRGVICSWGGGWVGGGVGGGGGLVGILRGLFFCRGGGGGAE